MFPAQADGRLARPELPKALLTNYVALAFSPAGSVVRVVAQQGGTLHGTPESDQQARSQIGLDDSFRLMSVASGQAQQVNKGRAENKVLAVGVPDADARSLLALFKERAPAPYSLELSGLASLNAAVKSAMSDAPDEPVCLLDCGARVSMMVFMNKGAVILARKLDVGGDAVIERVEKFMGVDRAMAESIMSEGAIDISSAVREVSDPFLRQVMISRDFVERQENCQVGRVLITGGMAMSAYWLEELRRTTGMSVSGWDPLAGLQFAGQGAPKVLDGQACRFSAAIGAARGALEDANS
jgi:Tfp pilus assembly PilM family ATPase